MTQRIRIEICAKEFAKSGIVIYIIIIIIVKELV